MTHCASGKTIVSIRDCRPIANGETESGKDGVGLHNKEGTSTSEDTELEYSSCVDEDGKRELLFRDKGEDYTGN